MIYQMLTRGKPFDGAWVGSLRSWAVGYREEWFSLTPGSSDAVTMEAHPQYLPILSFSQISTSVVDQLAFRRYIFRSILLDEHNDIPNAVDIDRNIRESLRQLAFLLNLRERWSLNGDYRHSGSS